MTHLETPGQEWLFRQLTLIKGQPLTPAEMDAGVKTPEAINNLMLARYIYMLNLPEDVVRKKCREGVMQAVLDEIHLTVQPASLALLWDAYEFQVVTLARHLYLMALKLDVVSGYKVEGAMRRLVEDYPYPEPAQGWKISLRRKFFGRKFPETLMGVEQAVKFFAAMEILVTEQGATVVNPLPSPFGNGLFNLRIPL